MTLPKIIEQNAVKLIDPGSLNVIVGRNGSGKSRFLRELESLRHAGGYFVQYISPERAGSFEFDPGVEHSVRGNRTWIEETRKRNQVTNFKQASAKRLRDLAMRFALKMETDRELRESFDKTFSTEKLNKINQMLSNIYLSRDGAEAFVFKTIDEEILAPDQLSSGESEIVALGTEILHFFELCEPNRTNLLLLDEPDVHLHPDLQSRLARFLINEISELPTDVREATAVIITTHSTPLICELVRYENCTLGVKHYGNMNVVQHKATEQLQKLAPFFGHPLSRVIADDLPLIVEGEDDERVWQQAARTSQGRLKVFPVVAGTVVHLKDLESSCDSLMNGIYDNPKAISVRDGDGKREAIDAVGCVHRFRLQCYEIENLLLTDDVLNSMSSNWSDFVTRANSWCSLNSNRAEIELLQKVIGSPDRFRNQKIKDIRNLIPAILDSKKQWETIVGQALGRLDASSPSGKNALKDYVGEDLLLAMGLF